MLSKNRNSLYGGRGSKHKFYREDFLSLLASLISTENFLTVSQSSHLADKDEVTPLTIEDFKEALEGGQIIWSSHEFVIDGANQAKSPPVTNVNTLMALHDSIQQLKNDVISVSEIVNLPAFKELSKSIATIISEGVVNEASIESTQFLTINMILELKGFEKIAPIAKTYCSFERQEDRVAFILQTLRDHKCLQENQSPPMISK